MSIEPSCSRCGAFLQAGDSYLCKNCIADEERDLDHEINSGVASPVHNRVICPFCNMIMPDIGEDEYKCLNLQCPLADKQNIYDFTFHESDFNKGI